MTATGTSANTPRTPAPVAALRRYALTFAWSRAGHVVRCYQPGTKDLRTEARALLALGWREAKLAERHGHLVVREVTPLGSPLTRPAAAPVASRSAAVLRREIEDLENRDRLGPSGIDRLASLRAELASARHLAA